MFDGTDLNAAYGTSLSDLGGGGGAGGAGGFLQAGPSPSPMAQVQMPPPAAQGPTEQILLPPPSVSSGPAPGAMSHATPPEVPYYPPNAMYSTQGGPKYKYGSGSGGDGDSMWDKLSSKKYDVLKLVLLSLVILLAMSSDRVIQHYLGAYISGGLFTTVQEFLVRLSYPLVVLLVLWIVKASV
jgi:hypothetical protein